MRRRSPYQFAGVVGNQVELLAGGASFYAAICRDIEAARHELLIGTYLWEGDETGRRFLGLARAAARRGVRVVVLIDGVGSRGVAVADIEAARQDGVQLEWFHPVRFGIFGSRLFRRYHCKLVLVDGQLAYAGGAGFADMWQTLGPGEWWDLMARLRGPVVPRLRAFFARDWKRASKRALSPPGAAADPTGGDELLQPLVSRHGRSELRRRLAQAIRQARGRVSIANAYFVPGFTLRRALRRAARRGVRVDLLLPGPRTDHFAVWSAGRRHYQGLLAAGVHISEWQRGFFHAKYALVDDAWGYVGSSNLDNWSARFNHELDVGVESPGALALLRERFDDDLQQGREITVTQWRARPLALRLAETFFGWFDPLL